MLVIEFAAHAPRGFSTAAEFAAGAAPQRPEKTRIAP
jgi:hypothetical protein